MTFIEQGTLGAYRQTWRKGNPRSLLKTIMEKNPKADPQKLYRLYWEEVEGDKELLRDIVGYWLDHNYQSLLRDCEPESRRRHERASASSSSAAAAPAAAKLQERVEHETRLVLLDLTMPNDKALKDCTGNDCRGFGGWMFQLAKKVPATKTVGATLSEDEVYKIWQAAKASKK